MLPIGGHAIVLWFHVLGACTWIGGQLVVAVLMPVTRGEPRLARALGLRFQWVAWPAFALLVVTGVIQALDDGITPTNLLATATGRTLGVKLLFVLLSGAAALAHSLTPARRRTPRLAAVLGGASLLCAIVAGLFGVVIAGG
jgi:putative copper export protein